MSPFERLKGAHLTSHPILEDLVFSVLSLLVAVVAITAITTPPQAMIAAAVSAKRPQPNKTQIALYGTLVDASGQPISGASVEVRDSAGNVVATDVTDAGSAWNVKFKGDAGTYTVVVTFLDGGTTVTGSATIDASPDMQWGVRMTYTGSSSWVFVPLPGY